MNEGENEGLTDERSISLLNRQLRRTLTVLVTTTTESDRQMKTIVSGG